MSKLFPAAGVDAASIAALISLAPQFAGTTTPPKGLGFSLINGALVPNSFLDEVQGEITYARLNCYEVTKVADLFEQTYLDSLIASEMDVLGECVLLLIEQGMVPLSLIITKEAA